MKNKILCLFLIMIIIFNIATVAFASDIYVWSNSSEKLSEQSSVTTDALVVNAESQGNFLNLESGSAILIEQNSGKVLYEHNIHEQLRPASVTKVMTILLIMEALDEGRINLEDRVPCSQTAAAMGGSQIWLDVREELSVDEMLKAICVVSANDCTVAMAEYLAGSEDVFVEQMNQKAKELGMNDTTFKNCHGIDEDGHVTSSYDIALMSRELLTKHPSITKYTTIWMDSLREGKSELVNTNKLVRNYTGATGLKTGSTSIALYNLSASATRNDLSLIAVIMKGTTSNIRFNEAQKLLDYGFSTFSYKEFAKENETVGNVLVQKGVKDSVDAVYETTGGALMKKGEEKNIVQEMNLQESISAPVTKGQKLGEIKYNLNGEILSTVNIVAKEDIAKTGLIDMIQKVYTKWFNVAR